MSRGHGHVQRAILALIESDRDGDWTISDLCQHVYGKVGKAQRVAVLRALRKMTLLGTWRVRREAYAHCLHDICSSESLARAMYGRSLDTLNQTWPHVVERVREAAAEAIRYRDADPIGKLDIEIGAAIELCRLCITANAIEDATAVKERLAARWQRKRLLTDGGAA